MEVNLPEGFTVFAFPRLHQKRLRTSNALERLSQEIKRRTRVVRVFPNEDACLRLVSAELMEFSEDWEYGKIYLNMENT
jgi:transposase-like protein